ncbi:hypothetical protein [Embleya sp. NPDC001921]
MSAHDALGRIGHKVKHQDENLRTTHPPGEIEHIDPLTAQARIQPFDPTRPPWTAPVTHLVPDDAIWYPSDGAPPARSKPFPIPPGTRAPRTYGCYRL